MNIKLTSILLSLLILIGCENLLTKPNDTSDDELISDILDSKQIDINMEETEITTKGRHDPCVGIRAVPVGEAMMATTLADHCLRFL